MSKPTAVIISDVHMTPATLELATTALEQAIAKARRLNVPLVVNGDTTDTKCMMRGEVINRLIDIFENNDDLEIYVNVGNHDLINEKGQEHCLHFLKSYVNVVQDLVYVHSISSWIVPYQTSLDALKSIIGRFSEGDRVILHQGVHGAFLGHYTQDKTSLPPEFFKDFRVISGHYHRAQDIQTGPPRSGAVGLFSYVGNPYTLNFGEASDPVKGFAVLMSDGSLERIPCKLRQHRIIEVTAEELPRCDYGISVDDPIWLKVTGSREKLDALNKKDVGISLFGHANYKLDKIYSDKSSDLVECPSVGLNEKDMLDSLIDTSGETETQCRKLKSLWRELLG